MISNNLFYQPNTAGIDFDAASGGTWSGARVENNLSTNAISAPSVSGATFNGNLPSATPNLLNPSGFDFHLQAASPAIGAGLTTAQVTNDFEGVCRPQGAGYDIGAFER